LCYAFGSQREVLSLMFAQVSSQKSTFFIASRLSRFAAATRAARDFLVFVPTFGRTREVMPRARASRATVAQSAQLGVQPAQGGKLLADNDRLVVVRVGVRLEGQLLAHQAHD
jgi:hypothetical protein